MISLRDRLRRFDGMRRRWSKHLERLLLKMLASRSTQGAARSHPRHILVIRCTHRIGNALFLLPFLQTLRARYPGATIDLVQSAPLLEPFIATLGISRLFYVSVRPGKWLAALATLRTLRRRHYDRVYAPFPSSTDHLIAAWSIASQKMGFAEMNGELIFHSPTISTGLWHYAHRPLQLLGVTAAPSLEHYAPQLGISLPARDRRPRIGFFTGARKGKGLSCAQWQRLLAQVRSLAPAAHLIHIQDPSQLDMRLGDEAVSFGSLPELARFSAGLSLFICADTGPLHLAAASGVPCLALYTQTSPARYGCLGRHHCHLVVEDRDDIRLDPIWLSDQLASDPSNLAA